MLIGLKGHLHRLHNYFSIFKSKALLQVGSVHPYVHLTVPRHGWL